jgi:hypothetical protein
VYYVKYRSRFTGERCVAVVTGLQEPSENEKTGPMAQLWFLKALVSPCEPHSAVCGNCPLQGGEGCYVRREQAPLTVWRKYRKGGYMALPRRAISIDRSLRLGAFGDPASMPTKDFQDMMGRFGAVDTTGYTHAWQRRDVEHLKGVVLASTDETMNDLALQKGWSTFCVVHPESTTYDKRKLCANERTGVQCCRCLRCKPKPGKPRTIYITAHGARWRKVFF